MDFVRDDERDIPATGLWCSTFLGVPTIRWIGKIRYFTTDDNGGCDALSIYSF